MGNVSRPLIGLLVATVAFFAVWIVALKPSSSSTSGGSAAHPLGVYQSAINRAKGVQGIVDRGAAAAGGTPGRTAVAGRHPTTVTTPVHRLASAPKIHLTPTTGTVTPARTPTTTATPAEGSNALEQALTAHKVLAVLFYNPYGSDDVAVKQELQSVPTHAGKVVKLTVPLSELSDYTAITNQVPVDLSPTLVIINPAGHATTITGFADTFEIEQRIDDAL
jgi:hypothetical protein